MAVALSKQIKNLIDRPNFGHLATVMADGAPQSAPVWISREGERVLICTSGNSLKAKNTRRDPRVSLSVVAFHNPYEEAQIRGRVVEQRPDRELSQFDAMSVKYTGQPWPFRNEPAPIVLVIEVEKAKYAAAPFKHTPLQSD
jgi:PPOX class probable F420-dependent enzyme